MVSIQYMDSSIPKVPCFALKLLRLAVGSSIASHSACVIELLDTATPLKAFLMYHKAYVGLVGLVCIAGFGLVSLVRPRSEKQTPRFMQVPGIHLVLSLGPIRVSMPLPSCEAKLLQGRYTFGCSSPSPVDGLSPHQALRA